MSNFKTHGEAAEYCKKYGFKVPGNINAFDVADSFLRAYNDGAEKYIAVGKSEGCCAFYKCKPKNK